MKGRGEGMRYLEEELKKKCENYDIKKILGYHFVTGRGKRIYWARGTTSSTQGRGERVIKDRYHHENKLHLSYGGQQKLKKEYEDRTEYHLLVILT